MLIWILYSSDISTGDWKVKCNSCRWSKYFHVVFIFSVSVLLFICLQYPCFCLSRKMFTAIIRDINIKIFNVKTVKL